MKKKDLIFLLSAFLSWRILLFIFLFLAIRFVPLQKNFLGGGMANYLANTWLWAWANFDGEHYLAIAQRGYGFGEQAFFPLYPLVIRSIGMIIGGNLGSFNLAGLLISNLSLLGGLIGLYKLVRLNYSEKVAKLTAIISLLFPTSFYFGAVYTESLFLFLVIWSFYFARKQKWLLASVIGALAASTRFVGILLVPALLTEYFLRQPLKENPLKVQRTFSILLIIPLGLLAYMYYLRQTTGDWLAFVHALPSFGEQRSSYAVLLPQVFYRYFFKILPSLNYSYDAVASFAYFPVVFTTLLETMVAIIFLAIGILSFFKLRLSYAVYLFLGYLIPTLSGSFSSLPRYVLVLFPAFILTSIYLSKANRIVKISIFVLLFLLLAVSTIMFSRGDWIS